jgi:hypothetical protein
LVRRIIPFSRGYLCFEFFSIFAENSELLVAAAQLL